MNLFIYDNQQPSLSRNGFEGSKTSQYNLEQIMNDVHSSEWKRGTPIFMDDDIV